MSNIQSDRKTPSPARLASLRRWGRILPALTAAAFAASAGQALAATNLFTPGATFQVQASSSPDTFDDTVNLTPGTTLLDGGAVSLTISIVSGGGSNEWLVFDYNTTGGGPLSGPGDYWDVYETGLQAAEPVDFIAAYLEFLDNGVVQTPTTCAVFGCPAANPVPGGTGTGWANGGYSYPLGTTLPALGTYIDPWDYLDDTGINSGDVNGYEEALEFTPTGAPEPETWALMILGAGAVGAVLRQRLRTAAV